MKEKELNIEALDCMPFNNATASVEVLNEFIKTQQNNVFWFSADYKSDDDSKLAEYDYRNHCWNAGRFVGEAKFQFKNITYKITIKPRFGEKMLFRMLEEIFNIRITTSSSQQSKSNDWQHFIRRIIAYIWLQKLANANLHGVPKKQVNSEFKGQIIRGRLELRKSIKPYYSNNQIVSSYREKNIDVRVAQIISKAYQILKTDFEIGKINIPDSAQEALNQVHSEIHHTNQITETDYRNIKYKEIYLSWKSVVDLSWDVIKRNQLSLKQDKSEKGFGFFIDMAEVWEQYLRSILKRNLLPLGWHYKNDKQIAYKGFFYQRELIPDLVFQKDASIAVWDAKYKRMKCERWDVDRSDFFQIHTYIQNYLNHKTVKAGGLLYPISSSETNFEKLKSPYLIHEEGNKVNFSINGIELTEDREIQNCQEKESEFINRIINSLE